MIMIFITDIPIFAIFFFRYLRKNFPIFRYLTPLLHPPCYPKRSPPIDILTKSNDVRHKTGIITTHFNCFLIHIASTRGSVGSLPAGILPKIDKIYTFFVMLPKVITPNRRSNSIERLRAQKKNHKNPFQLFYDSYSHNQGVTEVIFGGSCAPNRQKP